MSEHFSECEQPTSKSCGIKRESERDATVRDPVTFDVEFTFETYDDPDCGTELHMLHKNCKKNPEHPKFIRINEFGLMDLGKNFRNEAVLEAVRIWGEMTVRLCVANISKYRPEIFPDEDWKGRYPYFDPQRLKPYPYGNKRGKSIKIWGTGFVLFPEVKQKHEDWKQGDISRDWPCKCDPNCQEKTWAVFWIETAQHLVFDYTEAEEVEIEFFYNSYEDKAEGRTKILRGAKGCETNIPGDRCRMRFYTHDLCLINRLDRAHQSWLRLREMLNGLFPPEVTPAIIISHPHGCEKVVTVGEIVEQMGEKFDAVSKYNTRTCSGSSGAPVIWWRKDKDPESFSVVEFPYPHSGYLEDGIGICCQL